MTLTCISCKLLFSVPDLHQEHYKSDWHRYNLKRRLAELPSITKEDFDKRASAFKEGEENKSDKTPARCKPCNKQFSCKNALVNHLKSKKHVEVTASKGKKNFQPFDGKGNTLSIEEPINEEECDDNEGSDWESCDDDNEEEEVAGMKKIVVDTNDCLFCEYTSDSTEANVSHMTTEHSFFIPDLEYLVDLDGLVGTLAAKIHLDCICLWCHGKGRGFKSVESVKKHMIDKGHCKMLCEGDVLCDYADFYDYSSIDETKEITDVSVIDELLDEIDYELVLPSGATIGHRSLAVYYKQNLKPVSSDARQKVRRVLQHYKALGYDGLTRQAAVKKAKDISFMQRTKSRLYLKIGMKQNKFMPHFRQQVMF